MDGGVEHREISTVDSTAVDYISPHPATSSAAAAASSPADVRAAIVDFSSPSDDSASPSHPAADAAVSSAAEVVKQVDDVVVVDFSPPSDSGDSPSHSAAAADVSSAADALGVIVKEVSDFSPPSDSGDSPSHPAADTAAVSSDADALGVIVKEVSDFSPPSDGSTSPPQSTAAAGMAAEEASSPADVHAKIIKQVEYYFSDENLPTDKFLLKYLKKDKEGFVPISVIATFRKVKRLTKDVSVIVDALRESSQLVVSSDGKKVKKLHPLSLNPTNSSSETNHPKCCTVVVENLPEDNSAENIRRIFSQVGSVKSVSIHDPQVIGDANRTKAEKQISSKLHALVEYETEEDAEKAAATLNDETDWRNGLRVRLHRKKMAHGSGRKFWMGSDQVPSFITEGEKTHSSDKHNDEPVDEEGGDHVSKVKNGQKGRNRSKGRKYRGNNGIGHGTTSAVVEPSKPPPGPRMPDGTRGFVMGRGRPIISGNV